MTIGEFCNRDVALHAAFDAAKRQLEDPARRNRP